MDIQAARAVPVRANEFRVGHVFSRTFELLARRFVQFFSLTVVAYLPTYLVTYSLGGSQPTSVNPMAAAILTIAGMVASALASAAVTYGVVQELRGRSFTFGDSLAVALRRFVPLIGVSLCVGFLAGLGFILLIIPGLIVLCVYYVAAPVCVVERAGVFTSLSRSAALTKGHRWQVLGIALLLYAPIIVISLLLGMMPGLGALRGVIEVVWQTLIGAFSAVLIGVLYFQLRTTKEGIDIDQIAGVFD
jgi:hypothetical protein